MTKRLLAGSCLSGLGPGRVSVKAEWGLEAWTRAQGGTESALHGWGAGECWRGSCVSEAVSEGCRRRFLSGSGLCKGPGVGTICVFWESRHLRAGLGSGGLGEDQGRSWPCRGPRFSHEREGGPSGFGWIFLEDLLASRGPQSRAKGGMEAKRPGPVTGRS